MRVDTADVAGPTPTASDYLYRALAEHLPDVATSSSTRTYASSWPPAPGWPRAPGAPRRSSAAPSTSCSPPERAELLAARYRAALSGELVSVEVADSRGQPDHVWAIDVVPIRGSDGAVAGGMAVACDVTEQRGPRRSCGSAAGSWSRPSASGSAPAARRRPCTACAAPSVRRRQHPPGCSACPSRLSSGRTSRSNLCGRMLPARPTGAGRAPAVKAGGIATAGTPVGTARRSPARRIGEAATESSSYCPLPALRPSCPGRGSCRPR